MKLNLTPNVLDRRTVLWYLTAGERDSGCVLRADAQGQHQDVDQGRFLLVDVGVVGRILVGTGSGGGGPKGQFRVWFACSHTKTLLVCVYPH